MSRDRTQLAEFGGHIQLSRQWAYLLLSRTNFVKRKATTAKSKHTPADFAAAKEAFLNDVVAVVTMDDIPPELILNWDQPGIHLVPASTWTGRDPGELKSVMPMTSAKLRQFSVGASLAISSPCN